MAYTIEQITKMNVDQLRNAITDVQRHSAVYSVFDSVVDMTAAMWLVDELCRAGYRVEMRTPAFQGDGYWCSVLGLKEYGNEIQSYVFMRGETMPMAICKAWLAHQQEVENVGSFTEIS